MLTEVLSSRGACAWRSRLGTSQPRAGFTHPGEVIPGARAGTRRPENPVIRECSISPSHQALPSFSRTSRREGRALKNPRPGRPACQRLLRQRCAPRLDTSGLGPTQAAIAGGALRFSVPSELRPCRGVCALPRACPRRAGTACSGSCSSACWPPPVWGSPRPQSLSHAAASASSTTASSFSGAPRPSSPPARPAKG